MQMKRYFAKVDSPCKKPRPEAEGTVASQATGTAEVGTGQIPLRFVSWNINGLLPRLKKDCHEFQNFILSSNADLICLQEVSQATSDFLVSSACMAIQAFDKTSIWHS